MKTYKFEYLDKEEKAHSKTLKAEDLGAAIDKLREKDPEANIKNIICKG